LITSFQSTVTSDQGGLPVNISRAQHPKDQISTG